MRKLLFILLLAPCLAYAQGKFKTEITIQKDEKWWGAFVGFGQEMPFGNLELQDLATQNYNNQNAPLLISSNGRYLWSDSPFKFSVQADKLDIYSEAEELNVIQAGKTLKEAFLNASKLHFPSSGKIPQPLFFSMPQYNTWIELMYNQNQPDILKYAHDAKKQGFPEGVFMIDDNWQKYYGNFEFKPDKFADPKAMIDELHQLGYKIMLWICPFVSADSPEYRDLEKKGFLIKSKGSNTPAMITWWNGVSASYDLTNPEAVKYLKSQLHQVQDKYGVDGFKFDAGDMNYFSGDYNLFEKTATAVDLCRRWSEIGLDFPYNEYRASWKMGGKPLVQRLGDKDYSWAALQSLIPQAATAGLLGYSYVCPDMIGGGSFATFLNIEPNQFDQELIVRSAQVHAMMPMMQFSVAPWRILNAENLKITRDFAVFHQKMGNYILALAQQTAQTGEPILRHMEYAFPHQGFAECKDQFMLGDKYLVAPMVVKGNRRRVKLPKGLWKDDQGKVIKGGQTLEIQVPMSRLPYYEKLR
jgi:alpha-glucosidase